VRSERRRDWPTIPQIFIGGEFVGGCDILLNLHRQGELEKMLRDAGALVEAPQQAEGTGDAQEGKQHT
jgi:monothiol glutaredoxin